MQDAHEVVNSTTRVFVYGTLVDLPGNPGWAMDGVIDTPRVGTTPGIVYDFYGSFPYAQFTVDESSPSRVVGQVMTFDTDSDAYYRMNRIELGAGYRRRLVAVTLDTGEVVSAFAYEAESDTIVAGLPVIPDGDFAGIRRSQNKEV